MGENEVGGDGADMRKEAEIGEHSKILENIEKIEENDENTEKMGEYEASLDNGSQNGGGQKNESENQRNGGETLAFEKNTKFPLFDETGAPEETITVEIYARQDENIAGNDDGEKAEREAVEEVGDNGGDEEKRYVNSEKKENGEKKLEENGESENVEKNAENMENIAENSENNEENSVSKAQNSVKIAENSQNIAGNSVKIAENSQNVAENSVKIAENSKNIAENSEKETDTNQTANVVSEELYEKKVLKPMYTLTYSQKNKTPISCVAAGTELCFLGSSSLCSHVSVYRVVRTGVFWGEKGVEGGEKSLENGEQRLENVENGRQNVEKSVENVEKFRQNVEKLTNVENVFENGEIHLEQSAGEELKRLINNEVNFRLDGPFWILPNMDGSIVCMRLSRDETRMLVVTNLGNMYMWDVSKEGLEGTSLEGRQLCSYRQAGRSSALPSAVKAFKNVNRSLYLSNSVNSMIPLDQSCVKGAFGEVLDEGEKAVLRDYKCEEKEEENFFFNSEEGKPIWAHMSKLSCDIVSADFCADDETVVGVGVRPVGWITFYCKNTGAVLGIFSGFSVYTSEPGMPLVSRSYQPDAEYYKAEKKQRNVVGENPYGAHLVAEEPRKEEDPGILARVHNFTTICVDRESTQAGAWLAVGDRNGNVGVLFIPHSWLESLYNNGKRGEVVQIGSNNAAGRADVSSATFNLAARTVAINHIVWRQRVRNPLGGNQDPDTNKPNRKQNSSRREENYKNRAENCKNGEENSTNGADNSLNDENNSKNDVESGKNDEQTTKNDEKTSKNDKKTNKNDEKTNKNDEKTNMNNGNSRKREITHSCERMHTFSLLAACEDGHLRYVSFDARLSSKFISEQSVRKKNKEFDPKIPERVYGKCNFLTERMGCVRGGDVCMQSVLSVLVPDMGMYSKKLPGICQLLPHTVPPILIPQKGKRLALVAQTKKNVAKNDSLAHTVKIYDQQTQPLPIGAHLNFILSITSSPSHHYILSLCHNSFLSIYKLIYI